MDIAIIGRTEVLYNTAELMNKNGHKIKLIITSKEAPEYKKTAADFKRLASRIGARYLSTPKMSSRGSVSFIKRAGNIDIGISMNYVNVIPQDIIALFPYGILNAHGGDLPRYRGNACQAWAILNGEKKIGLCIHKMVGGELDSGDIIERGYKELDINTKIGELWEWMSERIPRMFLKAVNRLARDKNYILAKQSRNPKDALRCYTRIPVDGRIDWRRSNTEILRLINASSMPYSGAFCELEGKKMTIWDAEIYNDDESYCSVPGQISEIGQGYFVVITGKGKIKIKDWICVNKIKGIRQRLT